MVRSENQGYDLLRGRVVPELPGARYQLEGVVGRGDMTEVFRAQDISLDRIVAIKRLREDLAPDQTFQARFHREAQSVASLNHPSIVAVYDTGEDMVGPISVPYVVMEYVDGRTLRDLLRDGRRLKPARALEIVDGILRALDYSHRNDIVHRDIKPDNVMLTRTGDVKMMDFGIARALSDSQITTTQTSQVIGTAQYLSPEQARGEQLDARSDLYSTGCLLYELFTGRPPFSGDSPVAIAYQHVRENPVPPSQVDPEIPRWADAIVLKAMAKNPADRYQNAAEMRADIQRAMSGMPVSVPPNPPSSSADRSQPDAQQPREPVEHPARPEAWRVSMQQDAVRREAGQGSIWNIGSGDLNRAYHAIITDHGGFLSPRKRRARKNLQRAWEIQHRGSWKGTAGSFRDTYVEDAKRGVSRPTHLQGTNASLLVASRSGDRRRDQRGRRRRHERP